MDYNEWREKYKPIGDDGLYLRETYGADLDLIKTVKENHIWTLLDCDDGETYIVSGFHYVNRINYIITEVPFKEGEFIEVLDD